MNGRKKKRVEEVEGVVAIDRNIMRERGSCLKGWSWKMKEEEEAANWKEYVKAFLGERLLTGREPIKPPPTNSPLPHPSSRPSTNSFDFPTTFQQGIWVGDSGPADKEGCGSFRSSAFPLAFPPFKAHLHHFADRPFPWSPSFASCLFAWKPPFIKSTASAVAPFLLPSIHPIAAGDWSSAIAMCWGSMWSKEERCRQRCFSPWLIVGIWLRIEGVRGEEKAFRLAFPRHFDAL